ncbi:MAG TPA: potassium-transporting ATPase subunit KdpC [Gemmatimonadaceae bacterium]|jgi:K+-transporting ATPase ATPase C chain|nr:potassium-transporting ATPase subunit KdpC [Gemmatimonadaceae bacterium]
MLRNQFRPAIVLTLLLIVMTGLLYPGLVTGLSQVLFPHQANGSLIESNGQVVGSALIGQSFASAKYFHPRPSAAGSGYVGDSSSGTNKGPTDRKLADTLIAVAIDSAVKTDGAVKGQVPADMVTSSGSGLDPHISPATAEIQVARVARARGVPADRIRAIVAAHTEGRQFGFFGERRVNVLLLNLALDSLNH